MILRRARRLQRLFQRQQIRLVLERQVNIEFGLGLGRCPGADLRLFKGVSLIRSQRGAQYSDRCKSEKTNSIHENLPH
jgi:hypothetical protein